MGHDVTFATAPGPGSSGTSPTGACRRCRWWREAPSARRASTSPSPTSPCTGRSWCATTPPAFSARRTCAGNGWPCCRRTSRTSTCAGPTSVRRSCRSRPSRPRCASCRQGRHDAVVIQKLLALRIMRELGLENLRTVGPPLEGYSQDLCFAVRKGDSELLSLLNEGLSIVMADGTFRRLYTEWFSPLEAVGRTASSIVVGGDADYPPYEFLDEHGDPAGFNVDLTRAIARQMGLSVDFRLAPWGEVRAGLGHGEIDLVHGMFYSTERDGQFDFSQPYAVIQHVAVVRRGSPQVSDLESLAGRSILVMDGDIMHDLVGRAAPRGRGRDSGEPGGSAAQARGRRARLRARGQGAGSLLDQEEPVVDSGRLRGVAALGGVLLRRAPRQRAPALRVRGGAGGGQADRGVSGGSRPGGSRPTRGAASASSRS